MKKIMNLLNIRAFACGMLACVLVFGLVPMNVSAQEHRLELDITIGYESAPDTLTLLQGIEFALYENQSTQVGSTITTDTAGFSMVRPNFTTADISRLSIRLINGNGFVSEQEFIPLSDFVDAFDDGYLIYIWTLIPASESTTPTTPTTQPEQPVTTPNTNLNPNTGNGRILRFVIGSTSYNDNAASNVLEAAPFISDGRTMVPLRVIVEALGSDDVAFNNGVITFSVNGQAFTMTIGQALPGGLGTPVIASGRTFVPLRYIIENIPGAEVRWDGESQSAFVTIIE